MSAELQAEAGAWLEAQAERVIETALARVFLTPEAAFKQKKAVNFDYVDFTTPEKRSRALARELELNRTTAPDLYRAVRRITRADGGLEFDGPGELVDEVLEMRRFADAAVLSTTPDALDGDMAEALGRTIARFHADAPRRTATGLAFTVRSNANVLRGLTRALGEAAVGALVAATEAEHERRRPLLERRAAAGFSRRCHGDLHLGNIIVERGRPVLFDCIEFNDALSDIDVLYDLAFLLMDLDFRGRREAATRVLSGYLDEAARRFERPLLWEGLALLPLLLSVRAAVRAHVSAHSDEADLGRRYLAAAHGHLFPAPPALLAIGGLSGAGKSTVARRIAPRLGAAPGAVILRSDEVRKRQAGLAPTDPAPPEAYGAQADAAVFDELFGAAEALLRAGRAVVLDATFMRPELRGRAEAVARAAGVPFEGVWLEAPTAVLEARVSARRGDASDAGVDVLRAQLARELGPMSWRVVDASRPAEEIADALSKEARRA